MLRGLRYPHFEQIRYNTAPRPSPAPLSPGRAMRETDGSPAAACVGGWQRRHHMFTAAFARRAYGRRPAGDPSMTTMPVATKLVTWRTPAVIVLCGCLISMMSFGPRATLGLFLTPQSQANGWERDVFGLALAIQNILWGLGQPFAGMLPDRFGGGL